MDTEQCFENMKYETGENINDMEETVESIEIVEKNNEDEERQKYIQSFVNSVKEYVEIDDQLKAVQKDIQTLKARKQTLSVAIMGYMQSQEWDVCNISTGGKLMLKKSKTKAGIKKDTSTAKLNDFFKDKPEMASHIPEIMKMIFDEREFNEKDVIRRTTTRTKK